jgi:hypothetical protein
LSKPKREHEAFLDGYKPALVIYPSDKHFDKVLATDFPRITPFDKQLSSYIFFQTEEQKQEYQRKIEGVKWGTYEFHKIVGEALGFPKKSVEYYAQMRVLENKMGHYPEEERRDSVGVEWAGFFFSSHMDFVEQEVRWLFDTYQHEKAIGLPVSIWVVGFDTPDIPYGDFERMNMIVNKLQEIRKQKVSVTV